MAMSAATVMKLRSRLESPGRSQTSPKSTFSLRSMSFGATPRTTSRAVGTEACVLTVCSFRGDEVMLRGELYALPTFDASRRRASIPPPSRCTIQSPRRLRVRTFLSRLAGVIVLLSPLAATAQDASLDAVAKAMGAAGVKSIQYSGTGMNFQVGQN